MKTIVPIVVVLALCSGSLVQSASAAPDEDKTTTRTATPTPPRVEISLLDKDVDFMVGGRVRIQLKVVNGSPASEIEVTELQVSVPDGLGVVWTGAKTDGTIELLGGHSLELHQPGQVSPPYRLEARPKHWRDLYGEIWSVLLHRPGTQSLVAAATYRTLDAPDAPDVSMSQELPLRIDANPIAMYAGAVVGAVLGALLLMFFGKETETSVLIRLGRASVASAIVLLAAQATTNTNLPITIEVHDFFGGVILGLLGDGIATTLRDRIMGTQRGDADALKKTGDADRAKAA